MSGTGNIYDELLVSLRAEFVEEAEDNLNIIEILLENLRSGQEGNQADAINKILRSAHSLKGSSGVADFPLVTVIMHRLEDYLSGVKELSESNIDDLQVFTDKARQYSTLDVVQSSIEVSDLVRQLPDRHAKEVEEDAAGGGEQSGKRVIEAMMVIRQRTAGMIFERVLREAGLRVTTVGSSFGAIEMAVRTRPDIVICSGVIDDLSGVDVSSALKAMPATNSIPVCLLTSFEKGHHDLEGLRDDVYLIQKSNLKEDLHAVLKKYELIE